MCDGGRGPNRVQYALKENEKGYGGWLKAQMGMGRSVEVNQSLKEGQNPSLRGLCGGRENRGSAPHREAYGSVTGLTRVHFDLPFVTIAATFSRTTPRSFVVD